MNVRVTTCFCVVTSSSNFHLQNQSSNSNSNHNLRIHRRLPLFWHKVSVLLQKRGRSRSGGDNSIVFNKEIGIYCTARSGSKLLHQTLVVWANERVNGRRLSRSDLAWITIGLIILPNYHRINIQKQYLKYALGHGLWSSGSNDHVFLHFRMNPWALFVPVVTDCAAEIFEAPNLAPFSCFDQASLNPFLISLVISQNIYLVPITYSNANANANQNFVGILYLHAMCRTPCILMCLRQMWTLSFAALYRADHEATPTPTHEVRDVVKDRNTAGPSLAAERSSPLPATPQSLEVHWTRYSCSHRHPWVLIPMLPFKKRESDAWRFPMAPLVFLGLTLLFGREQAQLRLSRPQRSL